MKPASSTPLLVLPGAGVPATCDAEPHVSADFPMPARLVARLRLSGCDTSAGPMVTLRAVVLVLSSVDARVTFRSTPGSENGNEETTSQVTVVPSGERVAQAPRWTRGIPGRGPISIAMLDCGARLLAPELDAANCVDGTTNLDVPFALDVRAVVWMAACDGSDQHGPLLRVSAEIVSTRGVTMRVASRGSEERLGARRLGVVQFPLVGPGMSFYSRENFIKASSAHNPWVSVLLLGDRGRQIGEEQLVGRCVRAS